MGPEQGPGQPAMHGGEPARPDRLDDQDQLHNQKAWYLSEGETESGEATVAGNSTGEQDLLPLYQQFLRNKHPELSEDEVLKQASRNWAVKEIRESIRLLQWADEKVIDTYPNWKWTRWYEPGG
jgi:hypothetical protein